MYTVYLIRGPRSPFVYIGYCPGNNPLEYFLTVCKNQRRDAERFDRRFLQEHGTSFELVADVLMECDTEWEAFVIRNEQRAKHTRTISGPTNWPPSAHSGAMAEIGDRVKAAAEAWEIRTKNTAREAYAAGLWTQNDIRFLSLQHGRDVIVADLDTLTPDQFTIKYVEPLQQQSSALSG